MAASTVKLVEYMLVKARHGGDRGGVGGELGTFRARKGDISRSQNGKVN